MRREKGALLLNLVALVSLLPTAPTKRLHQRVAHIAYCCCTDGRREKLPELLQSRQLARGSSSVATHKHRPPICCPIPYLPLPDLPCTGEQVALGSFAHARYIRVIGGPHRVGRQLLNALILLLVVEHTGTYAGGHLAALLAGLDRHRGGPMERIVEAVRTALAPHHADMPTSAAEAAASRGDAQGGVGGTKGHDRED